VRRELLLLASAKARRDALSLRERGDHDGAAAVLRSIGGQLREDSLFAADGELQAEAGELDTLACAFDAQAVTPADEKYMVQQSYSAMSGRRMKAGLIRRKRPGEEPPAV
jgi:hypothetical protein